MKHLLIKSILLVTVCLGVSGIKAQLTIIEALSILPTFTLSHSAAKGINYKNSIGIQNQDGLLPNKLYRNFQLTDYFLADDEDTAPILYAKFSIPNQSYTLAAISFGGVTDYMTDILIVADSTGNIVSTLEVNVWYFPGIPAKQYRILADGSIIVSILKPNRTESIPFNNFTSFTANRIEETYKIENGKFVFTDTKTFPEATYTKNQLSDKNYNLWD